MTPPLFTTLPLSREMGESIRNGTATDSQEAIVLITRDVPPSDVRKYADAGPKGRPWRLLMTATDVQRLEIKVGGYLYDKSMNRLRVVDKIPLVFCVRVIVIFTSETI